MTLTDFHAKYFAHELTKRCASDNVEKLAAVLADAQVDLNPHQVEAALFAFRSPFSKGAILADAVGLGKTIEAAGGSGVAPAQPANLTRLCRGFRARFGRYRRVFGLEIAAQRVPPSVAACPAVRACFGAKRGPLRPREALRRGADRRDFKRLGWQVGVRRRATPVI